MSEFTYLFIFKVVLSKSMAEVVQNVIKYVRLALLTPEELKQIEQDNEKDRMVPVGRKKELSFPFFFYPSDTFPPPFDLPFVSLPVTLPSRTLDRFSRIPAVSFLSFLFFSISLFFQIKQISEAWKYHALRKSPRHNASVPRPRPRRGTKPREMYTEIQ